MIVYKHLRQIKEHRGYTDRQMMLLTESWPLRRLKLDDEWYYAISEEKVDKKNVVFYISNQDNGVI